MLEMPEDGINVCCSSVCGLSLKPVSSSRPRNALPVVISTHSQAVGHDGETEDVLLEDIQECVESIGEIMQSYRSKGATAKMCASTLCKRRRDETEVAISTAAQRLQVSP